MDSVVDTIDDVVIMRPEGQLVDPMSSTLKEDVREVLTGGHDVIVDFSEVPFTDSDGLGALVATYRTARVESRHLAFCNLRPNLTALLNLTRLHRVFDVFPDVESAMSAIRQGAI